MQDLHAYLEDVKASLAYVEARRCQEAAKLLEHILERVKEPARWASPDQPPEDFGAWHWIWLAHMGLTGETWVDLVSPELALRTAIDLLES